MNISGRTKVFTILAHPSSKVVAPTVYNFMFKKLHLDMVYISHDVLPDAIKSTIKSFAGWENLGGFNVTIPHKEAVAEIVDVKCPITSRVGVVNTVVRSKEGVLFGYNTDGIGALQAIGDVKGAKCLIIGAGGASRAIIDAFVTNGAERVYILNRSKDRTDKVINLFKKEKVSAYIDEVLPDVDVVVQVTPIAEEIPFDLDLTRLKKGTRCLETVMRPTLFFEQAASLGLDTIPGYAMLYYQTKKNFGFLTGLDIEDETVREAFKEVGYIVR